MRRILLPFWVFLNLLWFGLLPLWVGISLVVFRNVTTIALVIALGVGFAVLFNFAALVFWSVVFYLLLNGVKTTSLLENRLDKWQRRRFARWRAKTLKLLGAFGEGHPLLLRGSLYLVFLWPGPIAGVPALRARGEGKLGRDFPTLFLGCLLNVLFWTLFVYGLPLTLVQGILQGWFS